MKNLWSVAILLLLTGTLVNPAHSEANKQRAFLEAATYFITWVEVDPSKGDVVSDTQIELGRWPIVIYLPDNNCAVRLRTTTKGYTVWQMDFCKLKYWRSETQFGHTTATWIGERSAWCTYWAWDKNENYYGDINPLNSKHCSVDPPGSSANDQGYYQAWTSLNDINDLVDVNGKGRKFGGYSQRPVDRMIASFKYIVTLLTGKPY